MTVSSTTARASYTGNGTTTVFAVPFYFLAAADLRVILRTGTTEMVQTLTTNYTVTGAGVASGGSVTMLVAPAAGTTLTILRNTPTTQETDLLPNDRLPAESLETALDKLTMLVQQVDEVADRALQFPASDPAASPTIPAATARASKFLSFNASGLPVATVGVDASLDIFTQAGAGAVPRSVNSKLRDTVSVKDFGAVGDGVTDDTAAIQAALNSVSGSGGVVVIPPSSSFYKVTNSLYPKSHTTIMGYGAELRNTTSDVFVMIWALGQPGVANYLTDISVYGLTIDCNGTFIDCSGSGIGGSYCDNLRVIDCTVKKSPCQGIFVGRGGRNAWILNNAVIDSFGDGIHIGDQFSGEVIEYCVIKNNYIKDTFDGGIGITGGAHLVWIEDNYIDTAGGPGIDISGVYQVMCARNYLTNYAQIGIRVSRFNAFQTFDIEVLDNIVDGPQANQAAINLFGPNNTDVSTYANNPITVRGNRIKNVTNTGSYGIFATGAGMVTIDGNFIEGDKQGIVLSGTTATATAGPVANCKIRNNRFLGLTNAIGLSPTNNGFTTAANEFISCTNVLLPNDAANWSQASLWEADYKHAATFFKGVTYTETGTSQVEVDPSARIRVTRGQRVQLFYYAEDVSGAGLGDSTIELYDVTNSAVLATATITGNTSPYAWRTLGQVIMSGDAELTVRYGRTFAGGSLSIKGAFARIG